MPKTKLDASKPLTPNAQRKVGTAPAPTLLGGRTAPPGSGTGEKAVPRGTPPTVGGGDTPTPPDANKDASDAALAGLAAALRVRRRGQAGSLLGQPKGPAIAPRLSPRTLIGR